MVLTYRRHMLGARRDCDLEPVNRRPGGKLAGQARVWPPIMEDRQSSFFEFVRLGQCVELIVPNVYMAGATNRIPAT